MRVGWSSHGGQPQVRLCLCVLYMQINMCLISVSKNQMHCCFEPVRPWQMGPLSMCSYVYVRYRARESLSESMCCTQLNNEMRFYPFEIDGAVSVYVVVMTNNDDVRWVSGPSYYISFSWRFYPKQLTISVLNHEGTNPEQRESSKYNFLQESQTTKCYS